MAFYSFDGNLNDLSGNGYHGTPFGNASFDATLVIGDNSTDLIALPPEIIDGFVDFTVCSWVKLNKIHYQGRAPLNILISGWNSEEANAFTIFYHALSGKNWVLWINGGRFDVATNPDIEDNLWHYVVISRKDWQCQLFIDGELIGEKNIGTSDPVALAGQGLILGQEYDAGGVYEATQSLAGELDNLRIYNRQLTIDEVSTLYEGERGKFEAWNTIATKGLIAVRARGNTGNESIVLRINDLTVQAWRVTTAYQTYVYNVSSSSQNIKVYFDDAGGPENDVQINYIRANGVTYQAEDQIINTGVWQNNICGGSYSEWIHCEGYIDFGTITLGKQALAVADANGEVGRNQEGK